MSLSLTEIINNAIDELTRSKEIIMSNDETREIAEGDMLISDIDSSLERMSEIIEEKRYDL